MLLNLSHPNYPIQQMQATSLSHNLSCKMWKATNIGGMLAQRAPSALPFY